MSPERGFSLIELIVVISIATLTTTLVIPMVKGRHMPPEEQLRFVLQDARATCMSKASGECSITAEEDVIHLPWGRDITVEGLKAGRCKIYPEGYVSLCAFVLEDKLIRFSEFDL